MVTVESTEVDGFAEAAGQLVEHTGQQADQVVPVQVGGADPQRPQAEAEPVAALVGLHPAATDKRPEQAVQAALRYAEGAGQVAQRPGLWLLGEQFEQVEGASGRLHGLEILGHGGHAATLAKGVPLQ